MYAQYVQKLRAGALLITCKLLQQPRVVVSIVVSRIVGSGPRAVLLVETAVERVRASPIPQGRL